MCWVFESPDTWEQSSQEPGHQQRSPESQDADGPQRGGQKSTSFKQQHSQETALLHFPKRLALGSPYCGTVWGLSLL